MIKTQENIEREKRAARLVKARKDAGYKGPTSVCDRFGWNINNYKAHEQGRNGFGLADAKAYAKAFGVSLAWLNNGVGESNSSNASKSGDSAFTLGMPVLGSARAGAFLDITLVDEQPDGAPTIGVASDLRFAHANQYALLINGESMNRRFPNGTYVTCVSWADTGLELRPGMCLHVERYQAGLTEITVKVYAEKEGQRWLFPDSTESKFQPIELDGDEGTEIVIKGLITGSWKRETF